MSFFAGVFAACADDASFACLGPQIERAFRLSQARQWQAQGHGLLAHIQSVIAPEDRFESNPLQFCDGRKVLVLDGHIDNRDELIRALDLRDEGGSLCDSAILAASLEKWGEDACRHLIGDFAFACWDMRQRRLFLACDQAGGRVLYYHRDERRMVFATSLDALYGFPGVPCKADLESLGRVLLDSPLQPGKTLYEGINQIGSAHRLVWSGDRTSIDRYWSPDFTQQIRFRRDEDYVDAARELLDRAVGCRLRAIGPIACQLSGGFDSSGVAATAARLLNPGQVFTVTAVPGEGVEARGSSGTFADEWPYASAVAAMHPNMHAYRAPAPAPIHEDPRVLFQARGRPVRNFMNLSWFEGTMECIREIGARVVLSGLSGNATLSWKGSHRLADLARTGQVASLGRELAGLGRQGRSPKRFIQTEILSAILPHGLSRILEQRSFRTIEPWRALSAISPDFARSIDARGIKRKQFGRDKINGLGHEASRHLQHLRQTWQSRAAAPSLRSYFGFEQRDPLGDIRLVQFCIAIPPEQFMRDGITRRLARRVLADRLPPEILRENRIGRQNPEWFERLSASREYLATEVRRLRSSPLASYALDLPRMQAVSDDWPADSDAAAGRYAPLAAVLERGVNIGQFIEWVEGGCVQP